MHAIIRVKKHKSSAITAVDNHNRRLVNVPNADPSRCILRAKHKDSSVSLRDLISNKLRDSFINKHRKDAVVAVELMLTATPDFFRPDKPKLHGAYNQERCVAWVKRSVNFLKEKYGSNLIDYVVHTDEATPHIHAIVVPVVKKEKKLRRTNAQIEAREPAQTVVVNSLDAKNMFGLKALYDLQEQYPAYMSVLGLKRGRKHSKASHEVISDYYNKATQSASNVVYSNNREYQHELSM